MPHIVVLGGGFGGVAVARELERHVAQNQSIEVTLINRQNYSVFTPLLAEVSGNTIVPAHAVPPLRAFFQRVRFQQGQVSNIDAVNHCVSLTDSTGKARDLNFDYLVVALGSETNYHHTPGAAEYSFDLKTLADAIRLRNHVLAMLEQADATTDPDERQALLTFVAAGGGYAGVEGLGLLQDFVLKALRYYPSIQPHEVHFMLVSHSEQVLEHVNPYIGRYVAQAFARRGINVRLGVKVSAVNAHDATLEPGGVIATRTLVWAAGIQVNTQVATCDLPRDKHNALRVNSALQVVEHPQIFALGDCAAVPTSSGGTYAPTAQNAVREGKQVARNIIALLEGRPLQPFRYRPLGSLASLGHYQAVAQIWKFSLIGFPAWVVWRTVYLAELPEWGRRVRVALDWLSDIFLPTDIVQLPVAAHETSRLSYGQAQHAGTNHHQATDDATATTAASEPAERTA